MTGDGSVPSGGRTVRHCEDCTDVQPGDAGLGRRIRCWACGLLVCRWCFWDHHVEAHNEWVLTGVRSERREACER